MPLAAPAPHLPAKAKRVIYLFKRRAGAARPVRLQAAAQRDERPAPARLGPRRPAADRHVGQPGVASRWPARSSSSPGTAKSGAWVSELLPHHREDRRRALLRQVDVHRGDQPRPGDHVLPDRLADRRAAVAGRVAELRPGLDEREPADVRRPDQPRSKGDQPLYSRLWGNGFLDRATRASSSAPAATRCSTSATPTASAAPAAARCSTASASCNQLAVRAGARPRDRVADRPVRDGLPDADQRPRGDRPLARSPTRSSNSTAPTPQARHLRRQLPAGPPPGRARRAVHPALPPGLGPPRRPARPASATSASETDQASAALIQDLKQRGMLDDTLVIWGGEFGRTNY